VQEKLSVYGVRTCSNITPISSLLKREREEKKKKCQVLTEEKLAGTGTRLEHSP
jgi:hypothetical protein